MNELINKRGYGHQEIEFTFESSKKEDFYILQTRDHTTQKEDKVPIFKDSEIISSTIASGIGVDRGAMNGFVAIDIEDLILLSHDHPYTSKILVRPDTVPDDIGMIFECDSLLTARGGATSNAGCDRGMARKNMYREL
ncbi:hypothetical protein JW979_12260 [bacterium]|nr:hypothetical protein [candidate division CSSED10-310 bacterium]